MSFVIKSGDSGNTAEVDDLNRLRTFSTMQSAATAASVDGDTFFITHDIVNLTTANTSFLFHLASTDDVDWFFSAFIVAVGPSNGTGDLTTQAVLNPTGGTLISAGTAASAINMNVGSPKVLNGTFLKGVEGSTSTGGSANPDRLIIGAPAVSVLSDGPIIIAPGTSVSIGVTPPTGNTSMNAQITIIINRNRA